MRRQIAIAMWVTLFVSVALLLPSTGSAQTINACVSKNGMIRIVAAGAPCPNGDVPLRWNGGFRVYDANSVEIGPLMGIQTVLLSVGDEYYTAPVGPSGWVESQVTFYFFDDECSGAPYLYRGMSQPLPIQTTFIKSLQVVGTTGYYQDGMFVTKELTSGEDPEVWFRNVATGMCDPFLPSTGTHTYWFGSHGAVALPSHPAPFTMR